ncbi:MAG: hypothetical protein ACYC23_24230, partial [Limisphaerales bacterium]
MYDTPDPLDSLLDELTASSDAALDEEAANQHVFNAVQKALGAIAREHYPGLRNWEPNQLRQLGERISRHAVDFTQEL